MSLLQFSKRLFFQINIITYKRLISTRVFNNVKFNNNNKCILCSNQTVILYPINYDTVRFYAKGKDKKKEKGKKIVEINESQLSEVINLDNLKSQMKKSVENLKDEYIKHLSLRSTTGAIEAIEVNLDGKEYTIQELAQVVRKNPTTVILNMGTFPQAIPAVVKSLTKSGMNLNPQQDGTNLYIPVPKVTKEHRENLSKNAKSLFVKCKDHIRDTQIKFSKKVKNQDNLAEDLVHNVQNQITSLGDQYIAEAEKIMKSKQNELLGIKE